MRLVPDGRQAFRAVNLARLLQGLPRVIVPPVVTSVASGDVVVLTAREPSGVDLMWSRGAGALGPVHVAMVWASPRVTQAVRRLCGSRYTWCGCVPVVVDLPVGIEGLLIGKPVVVVGGVLTCLVGIAESGLSPFCRIRCTLRDFTL